MEIPRSCGILLHITSLPSPFGIGDLGPSAYRFADFLTAASVRFWQILPLNYTDEGSGFSPYSGPSAFAGNTSLISPHLLLEEGLLAQQDLDASPPFATATVDYPAVVQYKRAVLDVAYSRFKSDASSPLAEDFEAFRHDNQHWLADFALYMALKKHFKGQRWSEWPGAIKNRQPQALEAIRAELSEDVEKQAFWQFLFFQQWYRLKTYAEAQHVHFVGDMPFYVGYDSADVWAHPSFFKLDAHLEPRVVAGVPPDYFSETGQLWGMPIFDWEALRQAGYSWWMDRIAHNMQLYRLLRLDHFRAFSDYWEVPATETTAINGYWVKGMGDDFFTHLKKKFPAMPFIAEDLGKIDEPVRALIRKFKLPGMRVLQFAFFEDMPQSSYIPHHHIADSIVYTGTHDNNTVVGWFESDLTKADKKRLAAYLGRKVQKTIVHEEIIRLALQSVARLAVFPLQDLFGLGQEAIMNKPSTTQGNWAWRVEENLLTEKAAGQVRAWLRVYGREGLPATVSGRKSL